MISHRAPREPDPVSRACANARARAYTCRLPPQSRGRAPLDPADASEVVDGVRDIVGRFSTDDVTHRAIVIVVDRKRSTDRPADIITRPRESL